MTETEGLKQLLLESADCSSTKDDSIDIMMEKEKQKKDISDKIQRALIEIDQINTRLKTSKMEREEFTKQLTDIKVDITALQQDMLEDQHHLLKQKNQLNILQQTTKENKDAINLLRKKTETHELKLAPTSSTIPRSPWQLHSDSDTYPLLKSTNDKNSHFSKFRSLLERLTLQGDNLQDVKKWWSAINSKLMMTLKSNKCLPAYKDLTPSYDPRTSLIPPVAHTQHQEGDEAYKQFSRELLDYMLDNDTIQRKNAPQIYQYYAENQMEEDGFLLLTKIVVKASPQLGGESRDLTDLVKSLTTNNGELLVDYYLRTLKLQTEIKLQQDKTGKNNDLTRQFVNNLFILTSYTECLRTTYAQIKIFYRNPNAWTLKFPLTIEEIYNTMLDHGAPTTIIKNNNTVQRPILKALTIQELPSESPPETQDLNLTGQPAPVEKSSLDPPSPSLCAARFQRQSMEQYTPQRCLACGLTNKELHLSLIHI